MKRLVIITVGKTHSGKTTFARALEKSYPTLSLWIKIIKLNLLTRIMKNYSRLKVLIHLSTVFQNSLLIMRKNIQIYTLLFVIPIAVKRKILFTKRIISIEWICTHISSFWHSRWCTLRKSGSKHAKYEYFRGGYSSFKEVLDRQQTESLHDDVVDPVENEAGLFVCYSQ